MTAKKAAKPRYGLVLSLGGAPATDHTVQGLDGHFRPDRARPLEECGISLEQAKAYDADEGFPLALVELNEED